MGRGCRTFWGLSHLLRVGHVKPSGLVLLLAAVGTLDKHIGHRRNWMKASPLSVWVVMAQGGQRWQFSAIHQNINFLILNSSNDQLVTIPISFRFFKILCFNFIHIKLI